MQRASGFLIVALCAAIIVSIPTAALTTTFTQVTNVPAAPDFANYCAISADGSKVAFYSSADLTGGNADHSVEMFTVNSNGTGLTQITNTPSADFFFGFPSLSYDGAKTAFQFCGDPTGGNPDKTLEIFLANTDGSGITQLTNSPTYHTMSPSITADGSKIAFASNRNLTGGNPDGNFEIFSVNSDGTGLTQLTDTPVGYDSGGPKITGDGSRIAFYSNANLTGGNPYGTFQIYVMNSQGPSFGIIEVTFSLTGDSYFPSISDDAWTVVFFSNADLAGLNPDHSSEVFSAIVDDFGNPITQLTNNGGGFSEYPAISADGSKVAFHSTSDLTGGNPDHSAEVFTINPDGTGLTQLTSDPDFYSWFASINGNGTKVAFQSGADFTGGNADHSDEIFVASLAGPVGNTQPGAPVTVDLGSGVSVTFAQVTAAGNTTLVTSGDPPHGPPAGFRFLGTFYDISTTASYATPITIRITYDPTGIPAGREDQLRIFHADGSGGWQDATVSVDTVNHVITAQVSSLSWFAIGWPQYTWIGFQSPISDPDKVFKKGSTIPIKFRISELDGAPVTDAVATLSISYLEPGAPSDPPEVVSTAAGDLGNQFRYSTDGDLYIFNLSTKSAAYLAPYTYRATVAFDDGSVHWVDFSLKK